MDKLAVEHVREAIKVAIHVAVVRVHVKERTTTPIEVEKKKHP